MDDLLKISIRKIKSHEIEKVLFLRDIKPSDVVIEYIGNAIDEGSQDVFVLEKAGQIIGEITIVYYGFRDEYTVKNKRAYMKGLKIDEAYQSNGYG